MRERELVGQFRQNRLIPNESVLSLYLFISIVGWVERKLPMPLGRNDAYGIVDPRSCCPNLIGTTTSGRETQHQLTNELMNQYSTCHTKHISTENFLDIAV